MCSRCASGSWAVTNSFLHLNFFSVFVSSFLLLLPVKAAYGRCCQAFFLDATTLPEHLTMPRLWPWCMGVMGLCHFPSHLPYGQKLL